jgi:hypothetical protein
MKKHILKIGLLMIIFAAVFSACRQELFEKDASDPVLTVEEAQAWYETSQPEFLLLKSGNKEKKTKVASPDWKGAFAGKNDKVEVVETHIVTNGGFGFATENAYDQWKATDNAGYITSLTRFVVMKYRKTGEMVSFLMTIVGDKEYLETKQFEMWGNTYLTKDKDFSGLVLFHSPEGDFVNGWRYTKGKVTHTVNVNFDEGVGISLKSGYYNCSAYPVYGWFQNCTDYYTVGEVNGNITSISYTGTSCGTPYMDYAGTSLQCTYVENGSGTGGNGGTYGPPSDLPCIGDPVRNPNICPTSSGNLRGGLYGCVRTTSNPNCSDGIYNTLHSGVDIKADLGSNIYSMYPGTVKGNYYEANGLGNYTIISSEINGAIVDIYYGHLNYAVLEPGSIVDNATIIGIAGQTGNAGGTIPHVHIKVKRFGYTVDPLPYFATEFNPNNGSVSSVCN